MSKIERIEQEIQRLTVSELTAFRQWFVEFDAAAWDRQLEEDVHAGKLDSAADSALQAFRSGTCTPL